MSKKKRRKKKRREPYFSQKDFHHIFYTKAEFSKKYHSLALRQNPYCGVYIPKYTLHHYLHEAVEAVPVPSEDDCRYMVMMINSYMQAGYISDRDSIGKRLNVLINLIEDRNPEVASALEAQLEVVRNFH